METFFSGTAKLLREKSLLKLKSKDSRGGRGGLHRIGSTTGKYVTKEVFGKYLLGLVLLRHVYQLIFSEQGSLIVQKK